MPDSQSELATLLKRAASKLDEGQMRALLSELLQTLRYHLSPFSSADD
jgi:hypothetical protein